jgi:LmbE family N-acetylglucosaminyl deacetylase
MKFSRPDADVFSPSGLAPDAALARTTDLCIAAHADDIEIMAQAAIDECREQPGRFFTGVVVTDGAGSPRTGRYAALDDAGMRAVRREEQRRAAQLGNYNLQLQLAHPSADVKRSDVAGVKGDLSALAAGCRPDTVYLHNPADKHDTHIAVLMRSLEALRALPEERRPRRVLGVEVWRDLDWLTDVDKVALDAGRNPALAAELLKTFDSQISGGKRYDLATLGRRAAHATFHASHETDRMTAITWAMDLTPLIEHERLSVIDFTLIHLERLKMDVAERLNRFGAK